MRRWGTTSALGLAACSALATGCRDVGRFSSGTDHYEGAVVAESFVRTGIAEGTRACLVIDGDHLQDAPGFVTTSDGRFSRTPLRPIPEIYRDPLSTVSFGEGRVETHLYAAWLGAGDAGTPGAGASDAGSSEGDAHVFVSLMKSGAIELRVLRGAPGGGTVTPVFSIFTLRRREGECPF